MQTLEGHRESVKSIVFSPDGGQIASGSVDHMIKVWDYESGACMQTLEGYNSNQVASIAFSPDSQQIASGSAEGMIEVWGCKSGICMQTLEGHSSSVESVAFSPDSQLIVSGHGENGYGLSRDRRWICRHEQNVL